MGLRLENIQVQTYNTVFIYMPEAFRLESIGAFGELICLCNVVVESHAKHVEVQDRKRHRT